MAHFADVLTGINHIWNNQYEDAERVFEARRATHPRFALHFAEVAFLRSFITAETQDTEEASHRLKAAKDLAESTLKTFEKGSIPPGYPQLDKKEFANALLDTKVVYGDSLYMVAVLQFTRDNKLKGALNMRKSWKIFEECLKSVEAQAKADATFYSEELLRSLHFGAGFFLFAMSIIPAKFLKLIELAGFKADRDLGLKYIHECYESGGIRSPFATMVLLFNNLLLPRGLANPAKFLREADVLIKDSLVKYPQGSLFQVMGSHCARKQCRIEEGIMCMEDALANCKTLKCEPLIYKYELACCFVMKLDYATGAVHFEELIKAEKFQVRALCGLQLATCYQMLGQRDKAVALLQRIPSFASKKSSVDPIVVNQAKRYVNNGGNFMAFELLFIRRDLAKMEQFATQLLASLEQCASQTKALNPYKPDSDNNPRKLGNAFRTSLIGLGKIVGSPKGDVDYTADDRAAYLMLKGAILKSLDKGDEAIALFKELLSFQDFVKEKWYVAYSLYELGESLFQKGNLKEAQEAMKKCNSISGYDWEDPLKIRLRVTIDQLKKGGVMTDADDDEVVVVDGASIPVASSSSSSSGSS